MGVRGGGGGGEGMFPYVSFSLPIFGRPVEQIRETGICLIIACFFVVYVAFVWCLASCFGFVCRHFNLETNPKASTAL